MAIIVDKVQKRRDIALACKDVFLQNSLDDLTIAEIAKTAGIGKGTIYEYFKNKDDIVFEIVGILIEERNILVKKQISEQTTTKDKIKQFSKFFYSKEDLQMREMYKEFLSITLINPNNEIMEFNTSCLNIYYTWFESIIKDGIDKGELKKDSFKLIKGIFAVADGLFIKAIVTNTEENVEKEILEFHDAIFELIEEKK